MMKFLKTIGIIILVLAIAVGLFAGGFLFSIKYKGAKIPTETDEELNKTVCLYESDEGKAYIDSEIDRLLRYRDEGIENYFPDLSHEEVTEYVEANLHTLICQLEEGYGGLGAREKSLIDRCTSIV